MLGLVEVELDVVVVVCVDVVVEVVLCVVVAVLWLMAAIAKKVPPIISITIDSPRMAIPDLLIFIRPMLAW